MNRLTSCLKIVAAVAVYAVIEWASRALSSDHVQLAIAPAIIAAGIGAAPAVIGAFRGNRRLRGETPEQKAARAKLSGFAQTGTYGDFTAGAEVPLGYGDFNVTAPEKAGMSTLQQILNGGIPDQYRMGDAALQDLLQNDPAKIAAQFDPFKAQTERQIAESDRTLKRSAGFAGSLYSTDTIRRLGDLQARGNETLTSQLANLTNSALDRKLSAIPLAYQSAESQQASGLQRVDASQRYGDLTRRLNDASIKARDAELLRRRQELQLPIQAAGAVMGSSYTPDVQTSPYQDLLGMVGQVGGNYLGNELYLDQYKKRFPGGTGGPGTMARPN